MPASRSLNGDIMPPLAVATALVECDSGRGGSIDVALSDRLSPGAVLSLLRV